MFLSGFLRPELGSQALAEPPQSPLVLGLFRPDLLHDAVNDLQPTREFLLLVRAGLSTVAQGLVLPFLQCLQLLLVLLVGHKVQQVLSKARREGAVTAGKAWVGLMSGAVTITREGQCCEFPPITDKQRPQPGY